MIQKFNFALLGHKVSYSLSPAIYKAIFELVGIEGEVRLFDLEPEIFESSLDDLFDFADGISVTIPYKTDIIKHLDKVDPLANKIKAVNSIAIKNNLKSGYNTDVYGFGFPLLQLKDREKIETALVLGNGGSAKAICYSLKNDLQCEKVIIAARDQAKSAEIISDLSAEDIIHPIAYNKIDQNIIESTDLIVNCTPLGGANQPDIMPLDRTIQIKRKSVYYDLNYNKNNQMIKQCREAGLVTIDGSAMLIAQALKSFELWTGKIVDFDLLYHKVFSDEQ